MNPLIQSKNTTILPVFIALTLGCFGLSPQARAVCQQGCDLSNGNTFLGDDALVNNTTGFSNTATGIQALNSNTTATSNTATGAFALNLNTTGSSNTATGSLALFLNTTGDGNTANGSGALENNTTGSSNTATGAVALFGNTTGNLNTATGVFALSSNSSGNSNTATGFNALSRNGGGDNNTATGHNALVSNTTGSYNIALGAEAGGHLTTGSNNIDIANRGVAGEADTIRIGTRERHMNTFIAGINGVTVAGGVGVIIDIHGHLGTVVSSERFKDGIKPMDKASEAILALKPVTFRYKKELDPKGIPQFGLVAEEVEKVNPALVARDAEGKVFTVRYEAVNAMLLNEFLKEHKKVEEQQASIRQLQNEMQTMVAQLREQAAQIQKVSAQIQVNKPAPQVVNNP